MQTSEGKFISLFFRPPTPKELAKSCAIYDASYVNALTNGVDNEEDTLTNLISLGQWNGQEESVISGIQNDINNIRRGLLDFLFNKTKLEKARNVLRKAELELCKRLTRRHDLLKDSAEFLALTSKQRYIISQITEDENGNKLWPTQESLDNFCDVDFVQKLCEFYFLQSNVSSTDIRLIARSQQWRMIWEISKKTGQLFDGTVSSWTHNQKELAYWSSIYDSVYEAYERPSKDIIEDDDLLDSWLIRQGEKNEQKNKSNSMDKNPKPGKNEQFIFTDQEGAKKVYDLNDPNNRRIISARQKRINQQGTVKEQHMPDSQREIREKAINMQRQRVKDISKR